MNISVIIPVNLSVPLHYCLLSLSMQQYRDFEVIVVVNADGPNDCDNIRKELAEYGGASSVYFSPKVLNQYASRNLGIQKAKSDVLLFLNQDMLLDPIYLSDLYLLINGELTNNFIIHSERSHLEPGWGFKIVGGNVPDEDVKSFLLQWGNSFDTWKKVAVVKDMGWSSFSSDNLCVAKSFIDKHDLYFDEDYSGWGMGDIDWSYRAKEKNGLFINGASQCWHISHPFNVETRRREFRMNTRRYIHKNLKEWARDRERFEQCHAHFRMEVDGVGSKLVSDFDELDGIK